MQPYSATSDVHGRGFGGAHEGGRMVLLARFLFAGLSFVGLLLASPSRPMACVASSEAYDRGRARAVYEASLENVTFPTAEKDVGIATFTILGGGDGLGRSVALKGWMKLDNNPCPSVSVTIMSEFKPGRIYRFIDVSPFPGPDVYKVDLRFEHLVVYGP